MDFTPKLGHPVWKVLFVLSIGFLLFSTLVPMKIQQVPIIHIDKIFHFLVFAGVAFLSMNAFISINRWLLGSLLSGLGLAIEIIQYFIPGRSFSLADWLADSLGVLLVLLFFRVRRRIKNS